MWHNFIFFKLEPLFLTNESNDGNRPSVHLLGNLLIHIKYILNNKIPINQLTFNSYLNTPYQFYWPAKLKECSVRLLLRTSYVCTSCNQVRSVVIKVSSQTGFCITCVSHVRWDHAWNVFMKSFLTFFEHLYRSFPHNHQGTFTGNLTSDYPFLPITPNSCRPSSISYRLIHVLCGTMLNMYIAVIIKIHYDKPAQNIPCP